jgi:hypothetical protein
VDNPDPYDLENTLVKMSKKRAHLDAALTGTASSDLFTQDLDEQHEEPKPRAAQSRPAPQGAPAGSQEPGGDYDEPWEPGEDYGDVPSQPARPVTAKPRARAAGPASDKTATCPHCGNPAKPSKYPKSGQTFYCYGCKHPFEPGAEA